MISDFGTSNFREKALLLTILALMMFLLTNCAIVDPSQLELRIAPSSSTVVAQDSSFYLYFSESVDRDSAQNAVSIKQGESAVALDFQWSGNTLIARPIQPLEPGFMYYFKVAGAVKDQYGNSVSFARSVLFQVQGNFRLPHLLSYQPADGQLVGVEEPLVLEFSEPMDSYAVKSGFELSGSSDYELEWDSTNSTLSVSPKTRWAQPRIYRWQLSATEVRSAAGQLLEQSFQGYFQVGQDLIRPQVLAMEPANCLTYVGTGDTDFASEDCLLLSWSEDMREQQTRSALSLNPSKEGVWLVLSPSSYLFQPAAPWDVAEKYILTASTAAQDLAGNAMLEEYTSQFAVQNVSVVQVTITGSDRSGANFVLDSDDYEEIDTTTDTSTGLDREVYTFTIQLSQDYDDAHKSNIVDAISLKAVFPNDLLAPARQKLTWNNDQSLAIDYSGFELSTTVPASTKYYQLEISSGSDTANENGNYIAEDIQLKMSIAP